MAKRQVGSATSVADAVRVKMRELDDPEQIKLLEWVLVQLHGYARLVGKMAKNKRRGDSDYYSRISRERWEKERKPFVL